MSARKVLHREAKERWLASIGSDETPLTWCGRKTTEVTCAVSLRGLECATCRWARTRRYNEYRRDLRKWNADEPMVHPFCERVHRRSEGCDGMGNVPPVSP